MSRLCPNGDLPVVCSACLQSPAAHSPKIQYIDFNAAYDGPVVQDPERPATELGVYIEKIVICENCVREAARHLGMEDAESTKQESAAWRDYAEQLEEDAKAKDRAVSNLSHTVGALLDSPVKRPAGRPVLTGPESHEEEIKELRSKQSKKERVKKATSGAATG